MDFLAAVLEHADAAVVACNAAGEVVVYNQAARKLFGERLPESHPLFRALLEGAARSMEVSIASGSILASVEPLFDAKRNRIGAVATCAPLLNARGERRKEAEQDRKRLELLLESTGEGIYGVDLEGRCTFINGSAAAMLGCTRGDLLGKRLHDLIHHTRPDGRPYPDDACPIYQAFREGHGCRVDDERFFRLDGSSFPAEYSSYPIFDAGALQGAVVTFSDVTARRRAEEALRASEAKYRSLFETVSEGVYQTSPSGELLAANRALVDMLGYGSEQELRAQDVTDLYVNPDDRRRLTQQLERDGKLEGAELQLKRKDGRTIRVIENGRAIRDERKRLVYYEGTLTLVDARK